MQEANFGSQIRQLRLQAGMTHVEFAQRIGVTNITVSKWENEHQTPSLNRMAVLRRVLGADHGRVVPGDALTSSNGNRPGRAGVTTVMTGVVMSLKAGVAVPGFCDRETGATAGPRQETAEWSGPVPCAYFLQGVNRGAGGIWPPRQTRLPATCRSRACAAPGSIHLLTGRVGPANRARTAPERAPGHVQSAS